MVDNFQLRPITANFHHRSPPLATPVVPADNDAALGHTRQCRREAAPALVETHATHRPESRHAGGQPSSTAMAVFCPLWNSATGAGFGNAPKSAIAVDDGISTSTPLPGQSAPLTPLPPFGSTPQPRRGDARAGRTDRQATLPPFTSSTSPAAGPRQAKRRPENPGGVRPQLGNPGGGNRPRGKGLTG